MHKHTFIPFIASFLTLAACELDPKNLGMPDSTGDLMTTTDSSTTDNGDAMTGTSTTNTTNSSTTDNGDSMTGTNTTNTTGEMSTTASSSSTGDTGEVSSTGSTGGPDPDYVRECQDGDFVCDDWGCENGPVVKPAECYKRCTPDVIGEPDAECDEPERPFCSQIGRAYGGDFDCNGCAHICVAASINQCKEDIMWCE